ERLEMPVDVLRHVLVRDDGADARVRLGPGRVERANGRRVERRAERLRPQRARDADVVDVRRPARDVRGAVVARQPRADRLHAGLPGTSTSAPVSLPGSGPAGSSATSPRAAASTAETILT